MRRGRWLPFVIGCAIGLPLAILLLRPHEPFRERVVTRPLAEKAEVVAWNEMGARRGKRLEEFPDPPGDGRVVSAKYWVSLPAYDMEIRRRGARVTLGIRGTDVQTAGGPWIAFAEGTITGDPESFRGAQARIVWSCVGLRHRGSADGVGRLVFSRDATELEAIYLQGYEALQVPLADTYVKAYGRLMRGEKPPYGAIRGQIPYTSPLARLDREAKLVVTGRVVTPEGGVVPDALVQLKGVDRTRVYADENGRFRLEMLGRDAPWTQSIGAGAIGYRNGETVLFTGDPTDDVVVELASIDMTDHPAYPWIHPAPDRDLDDVQACGTCHSWQYTEWLDSRHARMAEHGHVLYERERMRVRAPDAPDDCAACHQPAWAATTGRGEYEPRGVLASNHCDFCHKIRHVESAGSPLGARGPGALGNIVLARPDPALRDRPGDIHRVFGPAPDVSYALMGASYNPMLSTSLVCAGCHQGGGVAGRPKIDTFEEWRSWASDRENETFRSCQDCHMPGSAVRTETGTNVDLFAWESLHRSPAAVHSHAFPGATASLARPALQVEVEKRFDAARGRWIVVVRVTNTGAGHRIPTGTWSKHVAIGVWARQGAAWLAADGGERVPLVGASAAPPGPLVGGDWRNPPGTLLGVTRKGGDGRPADFYDPPATEETLDTRLLPGETRTIEARFVPAGEAAGPAPEVEVRVIHRRGAIGAGPEETPWELRPYDPAPQTEWTRIVR
jgi:hypothetical protein